MGYDVLNDDGRSGRNIREISMESIYEQNKMKFIRLHGQYKFEKLYSKVENSNALRSLIGFSVNNFIAPNPADYIGSANTIPYVMTRFNIGASVMASLIELKIWNERVNSYNKMVDEERLREIAIKIAVKWI